MAVTLVTSIKKYVGLSGDAKPAGALVGSEFIETDTGAKYIVNSAGAWVASPSPVALTGSTVDRRDTAANKPLATAVPAGTTYWSVDTDPHGAAIEVSTGAAWVVM